MNSRTNIINYFRDMKNVMWLLLRRFQVFVLDVRHPQDGIPTDFTRPPVGNLYVLLFDLLKGEGKRA